MKHLASINETFWKYTAEYSLEDGRHSLLSLENTRMDETSYLAKTGPTNMLQVQHLTLPLPLGPNAPEAFVSKFDINCWEFVC